MSDRKQNILASIHLNEFQRTASHNTSVLYIVLSIKFSTLLNIMISCFAAIKTIQCFHFTAVFAMALHLIHFLFYVRLVCISKGKV